MCSAVVVVGYRVCPQHTPEQLSSMSEAQTKLPREDASLQASYQGWGWGMMGSLPTRGVCWGASTSPSRGAVPKEGKEEPVLIGFRNGDSQDVEA